MHLFACYLNVKHLSSSLYAGNNTGETICQRLEKIATKLTNLQLRNVSTKKLSKHTIHTYVTHIKNIVEENFVERHRIIFRNKNLTLNNHKTKMLQGFSRSALRRGMRIDMQRTALKAIIGSSSPWSLRSYHRSSRSENELIVGGLAIGVGAISLQYALKAYTSFSQKRTENATPQAENEVPGGDETTTKASEAVSSEDDTAATTEAKKKEAAQKRAKATTTNMDSWFGNWNTWFAKNFYDGGFEDKMTKREAALILGVRESATPERVKEAHRKIMQINHPDKGGSAYLTAKVNEAKDLLLKGK